MNSDSPISSNGISTNVMVTFTCNTDEEPITVEKKKMHIN